MSKSNFCEETSLTHIAVISNRQIPVEGIRNVISGMTDFVLSAVYPGVDFFIDSLNGGESPQVLLLDAACTPTLDALRELRAASPDAFIILWVGKIAPEFALQALQIGVRALLPKTASIDLHSDCMRRVASKEVWIQNELSAMLLSAKQVRLSPREAQLMGLLPHGLKNKEIAYRMNITEGTVKIYLSRLFTKVGANDRFDLALLALRNMVPNQSLMLASADTRSVPSMASQVVTMPRVAHEVR